MRLSVQKSIIICGPTASGKTKLAVELAQKFNGEIVSADSGQVWREFDLGTAKPTFEDQRHVRHHLIDVATPGEHFDVAEYAKQADTAIADITSRGKIPFVVGGTGMYIRILLYGLCEAPNQDPQIRKTLEERIQKEGLSKLHDDLKKIDPVLAGKLSPNDTTRIIRGLEVYELTGTPLSAFHEQHQFQKPRYDTLQLGLTADRAILHAKIEKRIDWMIATGWIEEVRELLKFYSAETQAFKTIGYRELVAHLRGELSLEEAVAEIKKQTKAFAKRQMTWFKRDSEILWMETYDTSASAIDRFLLSNNSTACLTSTL